MTQLSTPIHRCSIPTNSRMPENPGPQRPHQRSGVPAGLGRDKRPGTPPMICYLCDAEPPAYRVTLPNGNMLGLCIDCCAWWRMKADWPEAVPTSITQLGRIRERTRP